MTTFVFYVSGHGFGHAMRVVALIEQLAAREPDARFIVRTSAPRWLFAAARLDGDGARAGRAIEVHPVETDTGAVQVDSLRLDEAETIARAEAFMATFDERVASEAAFLTAERASLVVADIPPLGVAAAHRSGVPAVALGNFTWDWIYEAYAGGGRVARQIGDAYALADVALRLPLHGGFATFPRVVDVPFIARRSRREPLETRQQLGLPADERLVLVSFGGYGIADVDVDALSRLSGYLVLVSSNVPIGPYARGLEGGQRGSLRSLDERAMSAAGIRYEDVVRAVDVVVTKPGYGIISDCIANDTALLYTSRGHFVEYDVLVSGMPRYLRSRFIDQEELLSGRWTPHLDALVAQPQPPERAAIDGADMAADLIVAAATEGIGALDRQ